MDNFSLIGGGIAISAYISDDSFSPSINNCIIIGNSVDMGGGGIQCYQSSLNIIGCSIMNNSAFMGAGVQCDLSSPNIINCTIAENVSSNFGDGSNCNSSSRVQTKSPRTNPELRSRIPRSLKLSPRP